LRFSWIVFLPALAYQLLAILASLRFLRRSHVFSRFLNRDRQGAASNFAPGISVLKPLRGLDPNTREAFRSQLQQDYPLFEILFGVQDDSDPAAEEVRRLQREFPDAPIRLIVGTTPASNGKVGALMTLARFASYPVWVVNDSDIRVTPNYLREVIAPLADREIGLVTCLYRAKAHTPAAAWEAFGISTDFMPSTLVAQMVGVREFGLGSTLAFRAKDLEQAGGFASVANYLADDYQIAKRLTASGKRGLISTYIVETSLNQDSWLGVWRHQVRWARTIRTSKGKGHLGLPVTQTGVWILAAALSGLWISALVLAFVRILSALIAAGFLLRAPVTAAFCWLAPVWDLYSFAIWAASYAGRQVRWRDVRLTIDSEGRIERVSREGRA
jgi:ceramide glucosyltransferase